MKRKRRWRPGGRPRQREQVSRSRAKQMLKAATKGMIPGKGDGGSDADYGLRTESAGEYGRPAA